MRRIFAFFALCSLALGPASAEVPLDKLKGLPILEGGRVKPLDTYARVTLLQLSSKSSYRGKPAIEWLTRVMFSPKDATGDKVFRINNPDVAYSLNIEPEADSRYSFAQLGPAISKLSGLSEAAAKIDEKKRSPLESELVRVANNLSLYLSIMNSFLFCLPNPDFRIDTATASAIGLVPREDPYSFMDVRGSMGRLAAIVQPLMSEAGDARDPSTWTPVETESMRLFRTFGNWSEHYRNYPLPIIPPGGGKSEMWQSPWALVSNPNLEPDYRAAVGNLWAMVLSYNAGDAGKFDAVTAEFGAFVDKRGQGLIKNSRLRMELFYNALDPFYRAKILYGLAILASLIAMLFMRRWTYWPGAIMLGAGALLQASGIALRVGIGGRAPIANLFETFVFVACVGAILGLALEFYNRKGFGILVGAVTGFLILLMSSRYDTDGDTIGVLVAVLNSNFWLTTHVITISLGYAGCCMAGVLGHIYLIQRIVNARNVEKLEALSRMTYAVLAFGLIFSFIGTVLGGVWADQSWGRFWGWDPKENGALLIVLWGALLFHAKVGKMIGDVGMAMGAVLGAIVVMMAWFGINLLGVGLHSYGFTSGVANGLASYVGAEVVFLGVCFFLIKRAELSGARA